MLEDFDVFLSYNSADESWVTRLKKALEEVGLCLSPDNNTVHPADPLPQNTAERLRNCACVAFVVSRRSVASDWVQQEYDRTLSLAIFTGKRLISLRLDNSELPDFLEIRYTADFRDPQYFDEGVRQLRWGITEALPLGTTNGQFSSQLTCSSTVWAEITWLRAAILRTGKNKRQLWLARSAAVSLGLVIALLTAWEAARFHNSLFWLLAVAAPITTGLVGWGTTVQQMRLLAVASERWSYYKNALQACAQNDRPHPECSTLRDKLWSEVKQLTSSGATKAST